MEFQHILIYSAGFAHTFYSIITAGSFTPTPHHVYLAVFMLLITVAAWRLIKQDCATLITCHL